MTTEHLFRNTVLHQPLLQRRGLGAGMEHGDFTLRDLYEQLQNVMKLGPLDKARPAASWRSLSASSLKDSYAEDLGRAVQSQGESPPAPENGSFHHQPFV